MHRIQTRAKNRNLRGVILFLCTDNSAVKGIVDEGNSTSKELFKLVCKL